MILCFGILNSLLLRLFDERVIDLWQLLRRPVGKKGKEDKAVKVPYEMGVPRSTLKAVFYQNLNVMATTNDATKAGSGGIVSAIVAYCFWGVMPVYWSLLSEATNVEILAHRIIWSLVFILFILIVKRQLGLTIETFKKLLVNPRKYGTVVIVLATLFASANWLVNIVGVNTGRVVELGLGTFLTPLATVAIGVVFFHEKLSRLRLLAIILAACGVAVLIAGLDRFPWIAVSVSGTWAIYGALKKKVIIHPMQSVAIEHAILFVPATAFLFSPQGIYAAHFLQGLDSGLSYALMGTGVMTSIPMILFSLAAQRLPMTVLGIIQYLAPVITLLSGVFIFREGMTTAELIALGFILSAVVLYIVSGRQKG